MRTTPPGVRREHDRPAPARSCSGLLLLALSLLLPSRGAAQRAAEARNVATSRVLFQRGVAFADAQRWEEAADQFSRALELHEAPTIALNYGISLLHVARYVEASEQFRAVIRSEETSRAHRHQARQNLERTLPLIATLHIEVLGATGQEAVALDRSVLTEAMWGAPLPVNPGAHQVVLSRGEELLATEEVVLDPGGTAAVRLTVPAPVEREGVVPDPREIELASQPAPAATPIAFGEAGRGADDDAWIWGLGIGGGVAAVLVSVLVIVLATASEPSNVVCEELTLGCVGVP